MRNPKTADSPSPKPEAMSGWVRKCDLDDYLDRHLPIPTQVVSNEEYHPLPQTRKQSAVEHHLIETAERHSKKLGVDRRDFLRTSCGMAAAFAALNEVFGHFFTVEAAELFEPAAVEEKKIPYFIFDVQTHHVAMPSEAPSAHKALLEFLLSLRLEGRPFNPELRKREPVMPDLHLANYIKEVFLDSETDVAVLSSLPSPSEQTSVLPPPQMAKTRSSVNELTASRRVVTHGFFSPDQGARNLELMQEQAEQFKIEAWKGYTGQSRVAGRDGWSVDDENESYPALEYSRKLGIRNVCLHKGLPLFGNEERWSPKDVVKASRDFPDLNFIIYHSGFKSLADALPAAEGGFKETFYIPWVSDLCDWRRRNSHMGNVYMELGSTFGMMAITHPLLCAHVLGMVLSAFGADHVLWGTDSVWWGSPQWQIEAFRRLEMPESLMKQFGYRPLSSEVKRQIFGLNAARLYGVDPEARRNPVPGDYLDRLKKMYQEAGTPLPSNTQYGWVRA